MAQTRLLIIGLDGGTFKLIRPWAEQGVLPNLKRLMDQGITADLMSTFPPVTSPAWPSFMTGVNPGKHSVFDFIRPKGTGFAMVNATSIQQPTIWDRLSAAGLRVGVINVPVTYPPRPLNGFMITGLLSPNQGKICYPEDLIKSREATLGRYWVTPEVQYKRDAAGPFIEELKSISRTHGRYAHALMLSEAWDAMMVVFGATDTGSHALWHFVDDTHPFHDPAAPEPLKYSLRDIYAVIDGEIGRLLEAASSDTNVIVMSDHGFGPLHYTINLNVLLMQAGLIRLKRNPWTQIKAWLFWRGISPATLYRLVEKLGLQNLTARVSRGQRNAIVGKFLSYEDIDWSRTKAFAMGHVGQIYVNTRGLHPHGVVEPGPEVAEVREKIVEALDSLRHPETGQPIVDRIVVREGEFHGPYAEHGPDIQVVLDGYRCIAFPLFASSPELFTRQIRGDSGCHRSEGVFIASGPGFRADASLNRTPHILDLAPTILHLMGLPIPSEMDGRPLLEILQDDREVQYTEVGSAASLAIDPETQLTPAETAEIEERLRSLGYLE